MKKLSIITVAILLVAVLALSACGLVGASMRGGGVIASAIYEDAYPGNGNGNQGNSDKIYGNEGTGIYKATFGFQISIDKNGSASGQVQYNDHAANVAFHGTIDLKTAQKVPGATAGYYTGTYRPNGGKKGEGGTFDIYIEDRGEPGASSGDYFFVTLYGGIFDGYANGGLLDHGNIQAAKK